MNRKQAILLMVLSLSTFWFAADLVSTLPERLDDDACSSFAPVEYQGEGAGATTRYSAWPPGLRCTYTLRSGEKLVTAPVWTHTLAFIIGLILWGTSVAGLRSGAKALTNRDPAKRPRPLDRSS